jgi:serine/threonine protein kinase
MSQVTESPEATFPDSDLPCVLSGGNPRYINKEQLFAGGYGEVWVAFDTTLGQHVAIKKLYKYHDQVPGITEIRKSEAIAGRAIQSPHVVRVYDLVEIDRHQCLVMEYVEGRNLRKFADSEPLTTYDAGRIFVDLCKGLAAIHSAGFVHRDMKIDNVVISKAGRATIVDLGMVDSGDAVSPWLRDRFLAPELNGAKSYKCADVYALGQIGLYLLEQSTGLCHGEASGLETRLKSVLEKCVAQDPKDRYADGLELLDDAQAILSNRSGGFHERHKLSLRLACILGGILVCFGGVACWRTKQAVANRPVQIVVSPASNDNPSRMLAEMIALHLETQNVLVAHSDRQLISDGVYAVPSHFKPAVVLAGLHFEKGMIRVVLKIRTSETAQEMQIDGPSSGHPITEALTSVDRAFGLSLPELRYDLPLSTESGLKAFSCVWSVEPVSAEASECNRWEGDLSAPAVPLLLRDAIFSSRRFNITRSPESLGKADAALDALRRLGITSSRTVLLQASLERTDEDNAQAIQTLRSGLASLSTGGPIYNRLSGAAAKAGFNEEALDLAKKALDRDPYSVPNYIAAARAETALWHDDKAVQFLLQALKIDASEPSLYPSLGAAYIRLGQFEAARAALERVVESDSSAEASVYLGLANLFCGRTGQAILILKGAAAIHPSLYSLATLGAALRWTGDLSSANSVLRQAATFGEENSTSARELGRLAMVYAQLLDISKADALLARAARYRPLPDTELLYDSMITDALAHRELECRSKYKILSQRHFPMAFADHDPQVCALLHKVGPVK